MIKKKKLGRNFNEKITRRDTEGPLKVSNLEERKGERGHREVNVPLAAFGLAETYLFINSYLNRRWNVSSIIKCGRTAELGTIPY